jgi:DNA-binding MarR family transcriptional regulator
LDEGDLGAEADGHGTRGALGTSSGRIRLRRGLPMHLVFFGLKRAFHGTLRVTRSALASLGLTAARFDLLYIVAKEGKLLLQRELQRALGVAASTVSRMLTSLEKLGLVRRGPSEDDLRQRYVELTKAGRRCVFQAARLLIHTGAVEHMVDSALCPDHWYSAAASKVARDEFLRSLDLVRSAYRDIATRNYPFGHEGRDEDDDVAGDYSFVWPRSGRAV